MNVQRSKVQLILVCTIWCIFCRMSLFPDNHTLNASKSAMIWEEADFIVVTTIVIINNFENVPVEAELFQLRVSGPVEAEPFQLRVSGSYSNLSVSRVKEMSSRP